MPTYHMAKELTDVYKTLQRLSFRFGTTLRLLSVSYKVAAKRGGAFAPTCLPFALTNRGELFQTPCAGHSALRELREISRCDCFPTCRR